MDKMTVPEILDHLLVGHRHHHRVEDAWDLLDQQGHLAAVLCPRPRGGFVAVSLPPGPQRPLPKSTAGPRLPHEHPPYGEKVIARVTDDPENINAPAEALSRAQGAELVHASASSVVMLRA